MKQQKRWQRWFRWRTERIEMTHETNTLVVVRGARSPTLVRCPECGSDFHAHKDASTETLVCRMSLPTRTASEPIEDELPARREESHR